MGHEKNESAEHEKAEEAALRNAQAGVPVAEKDFSPATREKLAAGTPGPLGPKQPAPKREAHGYGHPPSACAGKLRNSGHSGAHRIGAKK